MSEFEQEEVYICQECGYGEIERFWKCPNCGSRRIKKEKLWFWIYDDEYGFKTLKEAIEHRKRFFEPVRWGGGDVMVN